jgi:hypothetical protein
MAQPFMDFFALDKFLLFPATTFVMFINVFY